MSAHDFHDGNGPVPAHQHPNGGGWVADTARVAPTAFVSKGAAVFGNAQVYDSATILDYAQVYDRAQVCGKARVEMYAHVFGDARVFGKSRIHSNAQVDYDVVDQEVPAPTLGGNKGRFAAPAATPVAEEDRCECGAHKTYGCGKGQPGHSDYCPWKK